MRTVGEHDEPDFTPGRCEFARHLVDNDPAERWPNRKYGPWGRAARYLPRTRRRCPPASPPRQAGRASPGTTARVHRLVGSDGGGEVTDGDHGSAAQQTEQRRPRPADLDVEHRTTRARRRGAPQDLGHRLHRRAREKNRRGKPAAERFFDVDQQLGDVQRVAEHRGTHDRCSAGRRIQDSVARSNKVSPARRHRSRRRGPRPRARLRRARPARGSRPGSYARSCPFCPGERVDDDHSAGSLQGASRSPTKMRRRATSGRHGGAVTEHHRGGNVLAEPSVRDREHHCLDDTGWASNSFSTSRGATFSPPRLISSLSRPVIVR